MLKLRIILNGKSIIATVGANSDYPSFLIIQLFLQKNCKQELEVGF